LDFETLLPDQVLAFVDRLSMAHSVEVRPPFLDYRLIEFVATLPGRMKIKAGRCKHILKEAVKDVLPADLIDRPKEGFVLPVNDWLLSGLWNYVQETLTSTRISRHGLWDPLKVQSLLEEHQSKKAHHGNRIWNLMMFQVWWEQYFGGN
jgi:asparagine synthase (glutamine-hydrolysing)